MPKGLVEMIARRTAWLGLVVMIVALAPQAQAAWPEKPIKFVLPFGAGGVADVTARILADKLSQKLNQRVVVENMRLMGCTSVSQLSRRNLRFRNSAR